MEQNYLKATHSGVLKIGGSEIPCHVLENGERILTTRGVMKSLGRRWRGRKYSGTKYPVFLEAKNLKPFISNNLDVVLSPQIFKTAKGSVSEGYKAELLPMVCEVYLKARDEKSLTMVQQRVAVRADILMRGLAHIGIIALVDEATGYQDVRAKEALARILEKYIAEELQPWTKTFPDEFYKEMFRLNNWPYDPTTVKRPMVIGRWTNDVIYERLAPAVLEELQRRNPSTDTGHRKYRHHQWLTGKIGHPKLRDHINGVLALMRASTTWEGFKRLLERSYKKQNDQLSLLLDEEE